MAKCRTAEKAVFCHTHHVELICPCCRPDLVIDRAAGGRNSKGVTSKAKAKASAHNGRLGGRPPLPKHSAKCELKATGKRTARCPRCEYDAKKAAALLPTLYRRGPALSTQGKP